MNKSKNITFTEEARLKLKQGVDKLTDTVITTLGPGGKNVIIEDEYGNPHSTKDGVSVARSIVLKDKVENCGAQIIKQAASNTAEIAGDGTTTSALLAREIINEGMKILANGANLNSVKKGMELATKDAVKILKENSKQIKNIKETEAIATISANNDSQIGALISNAFDEVGLEGVVTVSEAQKNETSLEVVEGMQFDKGYLSPYFITNYTKFTAEYEEPYILLYDKRLSQLTKPFIDFMGNLIKQDKPIIFIAEDIDDAVLSTLIVNKSHAVLKACAVKAPGYGETRLQLLEDIATLTGGKVISPDKGMTFDKITMSDLGRAKKIVIDNKKTTIIDGYGDPENIKKRVEDIKGMVDKAGSTFERQKLQERLGKLAGGVAVINIGADTEIEMKEKKDRVEDALYATRAAIEDGIVLGGGMALLSTSEQMIQTNENIDEKIGYDIIKRAIRKPFYTILSNAGLHGDAILTELKYNKDCTGYDVRNNKYVDLFNSGIIDPLKVTKTALEKAVSVATIFLSTNAVITINEESNNNNTEE